jgi:hypothetical protein
MPRPSLSCSSRMLKPSRMADERGKGVGSLCVEPWGTGHKFKLLGCAPGSSCQPRRRSNHS